MLNFIYHHFPCLFQPLISLLRNSYSVSLGKSDLKFNLQYPSLILSGDLANQDTLKANQDNSVKQ